VKIAIIAKTLITSIAFLGLFASNQASAQLIPQPWVSVGGKDGDITYAVGARALNFGVEVGTGPDGAT
jgi:ABC-type hemin transport system substrate-binding protein